MCRGANPQQYYGTVTDSSGGVRVPNANVTITNDATNVTKTAVTNSAGSYTVTDLIPGTYTVKVDDAGFQTSVHNGIGVEVGHQATVDVTLQTGNTTQTVEVQENVIALDTTQPDLNTTIENKVVQELPLEVSGGRGRQIDQLIFLAPVIRSSPAIASMVAWIFRMKSSSMAFRCRSPKHRVSRPSGIRPLN